MIEIRTVVSRGLRTPALVENRFSSPHPAGVTRHASQLGRAFAETGSIAPAASLFRATSPTSCRNIDRRFLAITLDNAP
ncbi:hypothetical protein ABT010_21735 [Streptomyces sp. NPDC002668]|uniref:hypothetical protein n=1 Tax=Streptomyces sp. NPDC002668 TaxID=3154422 RepID=UPI00331F5EDA